MVLLVLPFSLYKLPTSSLAIFLVRLFFSCSLSLLLPCSRTLSLTHWFIGVLYISWLLMLHQLCVLTNIFPSLCLSVFNFPYGIWWTEESHGVWIALVEPKNFKLLSECHANLYSHHPVNFSFQLMYYSVLKFPRGLFLFFCFDMTPEIPYLVYSSGPYFPLPFECILLYFLETIYDSCLKVYICYTNICAMSSLLLTNWMFS